MSQTAKRPSLVSAVGLGHALADHGRSSRPLLTDTSRVDRLLASSDTDSDAALRATALTNAGATLARGKPRHVPAAWALAETAEMPPSAQRWRGGSRWHASVGRDWLTVTPVNNQLFWSPLLWLGPSSAGGCHRAGGIQLGSARLRTTARRSPAACRFQPPPAGPFVTGGHQL